MYGTAEIIKPTSSLHSPEVKHFQDLSELADVSEKCKDLTARAMKSSIHCATSIAQINTLLKTDISGIFTVLDNMKMELELMGQDISIVSAHMGKLNGIIYEIQDLVKDKLKSYDEQFEMLNKKLSEYGDIVKETNRSVVSQKEDVRISKLAPRPIKQVLNSKPVAIRRVEK